MSNEQIAWAAGLFCGEGSTHLRTRKSRNGQKDYVTPCLSVPQSNREVLDRFQEVFGVGRVNGPYSYPNGTSHAKNPVFRYSIDGGKTASEVLRLMWPYLSTEKRNQAQIVLDKWEAGKIGYEGRTYYADKPKYQHDFHNNRPLEAPRP